MEDKNLKVLHIMGHFGGGISSFIRNKSDSMRGKKVIFDVAMSGDAPRDFEQSINETDGKIYFLKNPKKVGFKSFKDSYLNALLSRDYDVVYCHIQGYRAIPYYYITKRNSSAKFVVHAHSSIIKDSLSRKQKIETKINQTINRKISHTLVGCGKLAIESIFGSIKYKKYTIIPNSIDIDNYKKEISSDEVEKFRKKYNVSDADLLIGHVGRLEQVKNHNKTLEIAKLSKSSNPNIKFLIIGSGSLDRNLKEKVKSLGLEEKVIFTGRLDNLHEVYRCLDCLLLPSFSEGLPTTIVESQASNLPAIISDTITKEIDFGINLVKYMSIEEDSNKWLEEIIKFSNTDKVEYSYGIKVIEEKGYSNESAAEKYFDFLTWIKNN